MYYTGTQEQCEAYNSEVTKAEGYNGTTVKWADVVKHSTEEIWFVLLNPKYQAQLKVVNALPETMETL